MKMQVKVTLKPKEPFIVPFNYNHQLQSAIYAKLSRVDDAAAWHDGEEKLFVFGKLQGNYNVMEGKRLCFTNTISFEVRSPIFDFCDQFQRSLETEANIKLFDTFLDVAGVEVTNIHINEERALFETQSPVVIRTVREDGSTLYYSPRDAEFTEGLIRNFKRKYRVLYAQEPPEIYIRPIGVHREIACTYKGIWIKAYSGRYLAAGDSKSLELLYNAGLGIKTAQGFGMLKFPKK